MVFKTALAGVGTILTDSARQATLKQKDGFMRQVLLYTDEDGVWIADVPSLPGCHTFGHTRDEALEKIKEAIQLWIEAAQAHGEVVPDEYTNIELTPVA
jgi:predicted RNase H-like HicB family nuclease